MQGYGVAQEPLFWSIDLTSFYGSRKICPFCCTSPMKLFDGNQKRFLAAICAQSKNLSAHLCITPTLAPQITSHLLVISSFPNLARFPHPLASRTVWHFEVKLGPHLPTVINYMKEALLAEFPNQQSLLCHPRVLLPAQYTYTFCFSVGMTLRLMINPKSQR